METRKGRSVFQLVVNRGLAGQKFHVRILDTNGKILLWSEKYRNKADAAAIIDRFVK